MLAPVHEEPQSSSQGVKTAGASSLAPEMGPPGFPNLFPELSVHDRRSAMMYVFHSDETERNARIQRVRLAIEDSAKAPPAVLTKITPHLNKEKGHVFDYLDISARLQWPSTKKSQITSSAPLLSLESEGESEATPASLTALQHPLDVTTGFQLGTSYKNLTADDVRGGKKARRRPPS